MATFAVSGRYRESDHIRCMLNADVLTKNRNHNERKPLLYNELQNNFTHKCKTQ